MDFTVFCSFSVLFHRICLFIFSFFNQICLFLVSFYYSKYITVVSVLCHWCCIEDSDIFYHDLLLSCLPHQSSVILMRLLPPRWSFELPGELLGQWCTDLSSHHMDVFLTKYTFRVENHWIIWLVLVYCRLYLYIVKLLYSVCISKYRWHWEILEAVCPYDVGICVGQHC